uniref:SOCS box domain-containing protein n=1 Tax=Plectus sambesii TaxID=2011161 RepID=A0A914VD50_9BILA
MENAQNTYHLQEQLMYAVGGLMDEESAEENVVTLLERGTDVRSLFDRMLPLSCAAMNGLARLVQVLLDNNADPNQRDGFERFALHYAAERSSVCVKILVDAGAIVDCRDAHMNTPLHWAAYKNRVDCVQTLLEAGADVNAVDANGDSALSWAALKGHLEAIRLLLSWNAGVDTVNLAGASPISRLAGTIAIGIASVEDERCLQLLLAAIGQFNARNPATIAAAHAPLRALLTALSLRPRTLQQQCRSVVRRSMGGGFLRPKVQSLPISEKLRHYVLLLDVNDRFDQPSLSAS